MLPKLCHLDNYLVIIIIIQYIYSILRSTHDLHTTLVPYLGTCFFSRYLGTPVWSWPVIKAEYSSFVSYSHRADNLCPILTGHNFCVLFS